MFFMIFMAIHNMLSTTIHLHGHSHRITILSHCDGSRIAASSAVAMADDKSDGFSTFVTPLLPAPSVGFTMTGSRHRDPPHKA